MSAKRRVIAIGILLATAGCGGANTVIRADKASYPISLSEGLRGEDGKLLEDAQKQIVGTFELDYRAWSALWTLVPIVNNKRDISDEVNAQVVKVGGDAIVELRTTSSHCFLNYLTLVGILPDCAKVTMRGNIVKVAARR
jgi:hypothetical protein